MAQIGIHLQTGFDGDEVVVRINGEERLRRDGVRTRRVLGLAEHAELEVEPGLLAVEIWVPGRGLEKHLDVEAGDEIYLGISLTDGEIRVISRKTPFGYG